MQFKRDDKFIIVVMEDNEDFLENINKILKEFKNGKILGVVSALGMLKEVKMGYWNGSVYEIHEEKGNSELLGISGMITPETNPPYHFHITISNKNGEVKGGHLISAKVCNTLEMILLVGNIKVKREGEKLKKLKII